MTQIEVKLNPDVTPAGSDLSVVNAARRSFNTRSEWDRVPTGKWNDLDKFEIKEEVLKPCLLYTSPSPRD